LVSELVRLFYCRNSSGIALAAVSPPEPSYTARDLLNVWL